MQYIVIEAWENIPPTIMCNEDGDTLYFDAIEDAKEYSEENCQEGIVVPLCFDLLGILENVYTDIENTRVNMENVLNCTIPPTPSTLLLKNILNIDYDE